MFALGIRYLNGWAMAAADGARKEQAEWPPHPDRVFMALAAAWFETGEDAEEEEALRWLEALPPPAIAASGYATRTVAVSYVPVNDSSVGRRVPQSGELRKLRDAGLNVLPEHRARQARGFPVAIPHDPEVYLVWQEGELARHRAGLERLAAKMTHVGHSASFVQAWVTEDGGIVPTWEPTEGVAAHRMRVFSSGRLANLTQAYNRAQVIEHADLKARSDTLRGTRDRRMREEKKQLDSVIAERFGTHAPVSLRPVPTRWQGYGRPAKPDFSRPPRVPFSNRRTSLCSRLRGRRVPLPTTLKLTQALRGRLDGLLPGAAASGVVQWAQSEWFADCQAAHGSATASLCGRSVC